MVDPKKLLRRIANDKTSSATHITAYTCESLRVILPRLKKEEMRALLKKIPPCQPSMAPLYNLSDKLLTALENGAEGSMLGLQAFEFLSDMGAHVYQVTSQAAKKIPSGSILLTYSASSLVLETLFKAKKLKKKFEVLLSEARPALEGVWAAKKLARFGIPTTLTTDAALLNKVSDVHLILLGADCLLPKFLVHKIGTKALVQLAKLKKIPVWVLATPEKFLNSSQEKHFKISTQPPKGITKWGHSKLKVENYYFDQTPLKWITKIMVTELPQNKMEDSL